MGWEGQWAAGSVAMVQWSENSVGKRTEKPSEGGCWDLA